MVSKKWHKNALMHEVLPRHSTKQAKPGREEEVLWTGQTDLE